MLNFQIKSSLEKLMMEQAVSNLKPLMSFNLNNATSMTSRMISSQSKANG